MSSTARQRLKLLSFNIQVGIHTRRYSDYITASWRHLLPSNRRMENLHAMGRLMRQYDLVALQEADGGSLRSDYINQVALLAQYAGFPYWHQQCTRNMGRLAQHSNGLLSKVHLDYVKDHKLPGLIPGRGAIEARLGTGPDYLLILVAHLALSQRVRKQQIAYLAEVGRAHQHLILMGDFNCDYHEVVSLFQAQGVELHQPEDQSTPTYPSWRPVRQYDHILVSPTIDVTSYRILPNPISDHLPVQLEVLVPQSILVNTSGFNSYHPVSIQS